MRWLLANMSKVLQAQALAQYSLSAATTYSNNFTFYTNLAVTVRSNFQRSLTGLLHYDGTGTNIIKVGNGTQGDYTYVLNFKMIPDNQRSNCAYLMLHATDSGILDYNKGYTVSGFPDTNHLSTGIQGTGRAVLELTKNGYNAKAYEIVTDYRFPSWLYQVTNGGAIYNGTNSYGATTCWERWNGWVSGTGGNYAGDDYNSFSHLWAASVGEWIYRNPGGINPDDNSAGYQNTIIQPQPQPGGGITNAFASFNSIHGPVLSSWTNDIVTTNFSLDITVPGNASASIYILGATNLGTITESGNWATNVAGLLTYPILTNGAALFRVGSGVYKFKAPLRF